MSKDKPSKALTRDADYPVGYARPPAEHQFKPGRSGNPNGRPRKEKPQKATGAQWGTSTLAAGRVLYEQVKITQNGKVSQMPLIEAVHRRRAADALKGGNRLLQREVIADANAYEQKILDAEARHYREMCETKAEGEKRIAEARSHGLPEPELIPHPDDIVLDHADLKAWVDGPETRDELELQKFFILLRDHVVLRFVYQQRFPSLALPIDPNRHKGLEPLAEGINEGIHWRFRWGEHGFWQATQPLLRRGFRLMEADMQKSLSEIEQQWKRNPALEAVRNDKVVAPTVTRLLSFRTRSRERRIWQMHYDQLRAVLKVIYGPEAISFMPKHGRLRSFEEREAEMQRLTETVSPEVMATLKAQSKQIVDIVMGREG